MILKKQPRWRRPAPRRGSEAFEVVHDEQTYFVTIGRMDGEINEVFVNAQKSASMLEALARDGAILISFALQYGAPLAELAAAITRGDHDDPATLIGAVLDAMAGGK